MKSCLPRFSLTRRTYARLCLFSLCTSFASSLLAVPLTFDADPGTPGIQTGNANWHAAGVWWDGSANVSWTDGNEATIGSGNTVTISQATDCAAVSLEGTVVLQNYPWTIRGSASGDGLVRMDIPKNASPDNGLVFETGSAMTVAWGLRAHIDFNKDIKVTAKGAGTDVTYNGFFNHTGGGNNAVVRAIENATFTFGPLATVNNQLPSWNARSFSLVGDGTGQFIFDPLFDVDLGGTELNPVGGLSVYRLFGAEIISQDSQNLPQIWKGAAGSIKHHGGLKIATAGSTVVIDNAPHFFDGGVAWKADWVLDTQVDLTHTTEGRYESNLDDGFGPDWGNVENSTLRKTGPAKFIMLGDHAYPPGSRIIIEEGVIEMHTDPDYSGDHPNPSANVGPYLRVETTGSGLLHLLPGESETFNMDSVALAETSGLRLDGGKASLSGDLSVPAGTELVFKNSPAALASGPVLMASGSVSLDGTVVIEDPDGSPLSAGVYPLVGYNTLSSLTATVDASGIALSSEAGFSATLQDNPAEQSVDLVLEADGGAKNVIIIIPDGASYEGYLLARYYRHGADGTEIIDTSAWTRASMSTNGRDNPTYNPATAWTNYDFVKSYATSSSQAGTTLATGVKSNRENINLNTSGANISGLTLTAIADAGGRATGIVSNTYFSHATPAAFGMASNVHRNNYTDLAQDILQNTILDLVLGSGHPYFDDDANPVVLNQKMYDRGGAAMYQSLIDGVDTLGWTVVDTALGLEGLKTGTHPGRIFGVAPVGESLHYRRAGAAKWNSNAVEPYEVPFNPGIPLLKDLAEGALNVLSQDPDGFFVMIEAATIDWAGHDQDKARMVETMIGFMETVESVVDWVENHSSWEETLVVIVSDHDVGLIWGPESHLAGNEFQPVVNNGTGVRPGFRFNSWAHTNALVPLIARGPRQERFLEVATGTDSVRGAYLGIDDFYPVVHDILTTSVNSPSITYKSWLEGQGMNLSMPNARMREDYLGEGLANAIRYFFAMPFASPERGHLPKAVRSGDSIQIVYTYQPGTGMYPSYQMSGNAADWEEMETGVDYSVVSDTGNPDGTRTCTIKLLGNDPVQLFRIQLQ